MRPPGTKVRALGSYGAAAGISIVAAVFLLELPRADLRVPFDYGGDSMVFALVVKSVIEHGWYWSNPSLGAPDGLKLYDWPFAAHDSFHVLVIKLMSIFSANWALLFNLYFLLGFPLIALSAMAVFRHFRVGYGPAIVGSVLFAFLPSRILKGEGHLFLDVFYQVPLAILLVLWVCGEDPPLVRDLGAGRWTGLDLRRGRSRLALLICALTSSTSAYYAFFTACLLLAGGLWASVERRSIRNAVAGVWLTAAIVVGLGVNGLPTMVYQLAHGANHEVAERFSGEAEVYGMKIAQLLLPVDEHRVAAMRELKRRYVAGAPLSGENGSTSLGLVGDVGFLALLGMLLGPRRGDEHTHDGVFRPLTVLNLMAVLIGTIGGLGSLFALLVSPNIRTYSRIAVFIAFFSLFAVVLLLDRLRERRPLLVNCALPLVLALGLLDQATPGAVRPYAGVKRAYASDAALVNRIEGAVPQGTAIFQLPYMVFPDAPPLNRMSGFDGLRPYLHSHTLRWSYPAMRGRVGDLFLRDVSQREPSKMLDTLAAVGFGGVLVDRDGYADGGSAVETALRSVLLADPLVSDTGGFAFFDLTDYRRHAHVELSPAEIDATLHPLAFTFEDGCYGIEREPNRSFRWCRARGEIQIENDARAPRRGSIRMTVVPAKSPARLTLMGDLFSSDVVLTAATPFVREIEVPPGRHAVRFTCDGQRANAPTDPRTMVWQLQDFAFDELSLPAGQSQ